MGTYLYGAMTVFFSCRMHVLEGIYTLYLPKCQGSPCSKQA